MAVLQLPAPVARSLSRRVDVFTTSGTFTAPAGVTYAIAYIRGGGGSGSGDAAGTVGGSSSAFSTTAPGGSFGNTARLPFGGATAGGLNAPANSAKGGGSAFSVDNTFCSGHRGSDGAFLVKGQVVVAGTGYGVTVGAGGGGGGTFPGGTGGSGVVWIEYEVVV